MKYRKLGTTDIDVSMICLGTMTWGEQNTEEEAHEQMDYALTQGINFFDTAELYAVPPNPKTQGRTEQFIGTWLRSRGKREELILATKIAGPSPVTQHIRKDRDYSKRTIAEAVEGSLKRLQTDYIDLYQLHWPARRTNYFGVRDYRHKAKWEDNFHEVLEGMQDQVKAGKIRHFGISNETPWGLTRFLTLADKFDLPRCMSVQNPYSLVNRIYEIGLAEISIREKAGLLAYSPLAFGLLSGKFHDGTAAADCRINKFKVMSRYNGRNTYEAAGKYAEIARVHGYTPSQMALAFINQQPFVTANIIGATTMDQLKENIASIDVTLTLDCVEAINQVHTDNPNPAP